MDVSRVAAERNNYPVVINGDTTAAAVVSSLARQLKTKDKKAALQLVGDSQDGRYTVNST